MTEQENVLILIPTFNESGNIESLYREIRLQVPDVNFLFVDDNSPDGTGQIIDRLAEADPRVFVLHREAKMGVGSAHYAGISWAYDHAYDFLLTMDCDFTHHPKYIKTILEQRHTGDILVGSRFMKKASLVGWNLIRKLLTWIGHALTTNLLGMPYDATGGFRLYNLLTVPRQGFDLVSSLGYSFFFESLFIFHINGVCIREIPIDLPPRTYGSSKMAFSDVLKSLCLLGEVLFNRLIDEDRYRISSPISASEINPKLFGTQVWDAYWERGRDSGRSLYNFIAAFYRKVLIRPTFNTYIRSTFHQGEKVLHAGCGSGQVDKDICHYLAITGMDISVPALNLYRKATRDQTCILHGSLFAIPAEAGEYDGIYNLGVMEHFSREEIDHILREFYRILRPNGRLVIFWPPEFGLSVIFFKVLNWFCHKVLGKTNLKFHPDEITRIESRSHAEQIFEQNGFTVTSFNFGYQDAFTHAVIIARKNHDDQ